MKYNRILTIQDISCLGQCSITVALPILSACGQETVILPSAVLSTHTGGFTKPHIRDLTEDLPGIQAHWLREGLRFDAIYTGYLGSVRQIGMVADLMDTLLVPGGKIIVDPAMADNGKLYSGFDAAYVEGMKALCAKADVLLPNLTEACLLTDTPYEERYDEGFLTPVLHKLQQLGAKCVVLTGYSAAPGQTGVLIQEGDTRHIYSHPKVGRGYHGTGDAFASAFVGGWLGGKGMEEAAAIAADFICKCIENTVGDENHGYGTKFETALPYLIRRLYS